MRLLTAVLILVVAVPVAGQVNFRPTDPPVVTADNETWYRLGEPVQFAGEDYYLAGPPVRFSGNQMVRTGHYNGIPLYADATIEPYSMVFVPLKGGVMQPYERLRRGDLTGTTGSRLPSTPPARGTPSFVSLPSAAVPPTQAPRSVGGLNVFTSDAVNLATGSRVLPEINIPRVDVPVVPVPTAPVRQALNKGDGIFVIYQGQRWVSAGPAVPLRESEFVRSGEYAGFPVYVRRNAQEDVIYLPSTAAQLAPYRLKKEVTASRQ